METNTFLLSNDKLTIAYRVQGVGIQPPGATQPDMIPSGNQSVLTYADSNGVQVFQGSQISISELPIGKLVTVSLSGSPAVQPEPPTGVSLAAGPSATFITLLLPSVNVSQMGVAVPIQTDLIVTNLPSKLFQSASGPYQAYSVESLEGTAQFSPPVPIDPPPLPGPVRPMAMRSASSAPTTTNVRVFLYDATTQWSRLAAMAVPLPNETPTDAAARRSLYYNAVVSTIFTVVVYPAKFSTMFDSLLSFVSTKASLGGLEPVFLTMWNSALIQGDSARASRAAGLWQQYSYTVASSSDIDPTLFYDTASKMLALLPEATLRSMRANGTNAGALASGKPFGQTIVSLASSASANPFRLPVSASPAPTPVRGGAGVGVSPVGGVGVGGVKPSPRLQFAASGGSSTAQDAIDAAVTTICVVGGVLAAGALGPELVVIGGTLVAFGGGIKVGQAFAKLWPNLFPPGTTIDVPTPNPVPLGPGPGIDPNGNPSLPLPGAPGSGEGNGTPAGDSGDSAGDSNGDSPGDHGAEHPDVRL
jgi:hypothetical protein